MIGRWFVSRSVRRRPAAGGRPGRRRSGELGPDAGPRLTAAAPAASSTMGRGPARRSDRGSGRSCGAGHRDRRSDRRRMPGRGVGRGRLGHCDGIPPRLAAASTADSGAATGAAGARLGRPAGHRSTGCRRGRAQTASRIARGAGERTRPSPRPTPRTRCGSAPPGSWRSKQRRRGRAALDGERDPAVAALVTRLDAGVAAHGRLVRGGRRRRGGQFRGAGHLGVGAHRGRDRSPARPGARPDRA